MIMLIVLVLLVYSTTMITSSWPCAICLEACITAYYITGMSFTVYWGTMYDHAYSIRGVSVQHYDDHVPVARAELLNFRVALRLELC